LNAETETIRHEDPAAAGREALLQARTLSKHFDISGGFLDQLKLDGAKIRREQTIVKAVNDVSLNIYPGETLSVVGESGCGKSTLARAVMGLYPPTSGQVLYRGERIDNLSAGRMLPFRKKMQMVFQDPYASLNPRMTVRRILEEPYKFHFPDAKPEEVRKRVAQVMEQVGVRPGWAGNYPHEFSGGQRQRISIARALMVDPEFIVADEPISALDVSIQAQILNLMMDMQKDLGLTYMFISHDLSVVEHISTRVAVMYLGTLCEVGPVEEIFSNPKHPYTRALLSAIPRLGGGKSGHIRLEGDVPTPINLPEGCVFHKRCRRATEQCRVQTPALLTLDRGVRVACHTVED
jgi:peptide/nickel transport system ATP-binding protein